MEWHAYKLEFAILILLALMLLNMRGVKESIMVLMPIFFIFLLTHIFIIGYAIFKHVPDFPGIINSTRLDLRDTLSQVGVFGVLFMIMRSYSMGAGTYTGIEAVSNGIPVLREPKVETAKRTMRYMAISLAFVVMGLMLAYIFYSIRPVPGKTLNTIFFERATEAWGSNISYTFILIALASEAMLLFVAAQTGFIDGPRVLSNMATDRWFPTRFSMLSDRLVTQNGVLIMSILAFGLMILTKCSVRFLVVLYSINVFITFVLSQFGMVKHWWGYRAKVKGWLKKLCVNGVGLALTSFVLISMIVFKFHEGGWITLVITGAIVVLALIVKRHYRATQVLLNRLNTLVSAVETSDQNILPGTKNEINTEPVFDPEAKTAVLMVSGFNGIGLHTLFGILRLFGGSFKNFIFLQVGVVDAGNFKGVQAVEHLESNVKNSVDHYVSFMKEQGYYAEGVYALGVDVVDEVTRMAPKVLERFPGAVFFGGQLIFPKDSFMLRMLHNYTVFSLQKRLYREGTPFVILPIRV
jgi:amino acid transporter